MRIKIGFTQRRKGGDEAFGGAFWGFALFIIVGELSRKKSTVGESGAGEGGAGGEWTKFGSFRDG